MLADRGALLLAWFLAPFAFPLPEPLLDGPAPSPLLLDRPARSSTTSRGSTTSATSRPPSTRSRPTSSLATLAAEDKRFYRHGGVDYRATARAIHQSIKSGRFVSGASTITQQLIKINSPPAERNFRTKFREIFTARHLEARWDKDRILTAYLNHLDYGSHRQGCAEAAAHFFGKPLADLSLAECALLAGLPQAPTRLNPFRNPERRPAAPRLDPHPPAVVFDYDSGPHHAALTEPLQLRDRPGPTPVPHLAAEVRSPAPRTAPKEPPSHHHRRSPPARGQRHRPQRARQARRRRMCSTPRWSSSTTPPARSAPSSAPETTTTRPAGRSTAPWPPAPPAPPSSPSPTSSPSSTTGYYPGTIIADIPTPFRTAEGLDAPLNFDRRHYGPVTMRHALANSLNVSAMRTLNRHRRPEAAPRHSSANLGLTTLHRSAPEYGLGLTIGNAEVTLLELTNAYATLARLGERRPTILFPDTPAAEPEALFSPRGTFLIADVLSDNIGAFRRLRPPLRPAPALPLRRQDRHLHRLPRQLVPRIHRRVHRRRVGRQLRQLPHAGHLRRHRRRPHLPRTPCSPCTATTRPLARPARRPRPPPHRHAHRPPLHHPARRRAPPTPPTTSARPTGSRSPSTPPTTTPTARRSLAQDYDEWFASADNLRRDHLALGSEPAPRSFTLRIISPAAGSTYLLDPELPSRGMRLQLISNAPVPSRWSSPTLTIDGDTALLTPGTHAVTAEDPGTGQAVTRRFTVESL